MCLKQMAVGDAGWLQVGDAGWLQVGASKEIAISQDAPQSCIIKSSEGKCIVETDNIHKESLMIKQALQLLIIICNDFYNEHEDITNDTSATERIADDAI